MRSTKRLLTLGVFTLAAIGGGSADAVNLIVNGDFESRPAGTTFTSAGFSANSPAVGWLDQITWATVSADGTNHPTSGAPAVTDSSSNGGNWARQWPGTSGLSGTMLMQGFSAAGLAAGTELLISFEYITQAALANGEAKYYLYGLDAGESWGQFPPNACTGCTLLDSLVLGANTQAWTDVTRTVTLPRTFTAIAFGVYFATSSAANNYRYWAGIDGVSITANVPEPGTLALLGLGLLGLGAARRKSE